VLWYLAGVQKTETVTLGNSLLRKFGVDRNTKRRCLKAMEGAGLIAVDQRPGRNPTITILNAAQRADQQSEGFSPLTQSA
jgi:hypothetical protein